MNLTDDWKAGRLKTGFYYVKLLKESAVIPFLYIEHTKEWEDLHESRIKEVLAPVPTYDELQELEKENKRLGKLARENYRAFEEKSDLYNKLQSTTTNLDVAIKTLDKAREQLGRIEDYTGKHFTQPDTAYWQVQSTKVIINQALDTIRGDK